MKLSAGGNIIDFLLHVISWKLEGPDFSIRQLVIYVNKLLMGNVGDLKKRKTKRKHIHNLRKRLMIFVSHIVGKEALGNLIATGQIEGNGDK